MDEKWKNRAVDGWMDGGREGCMDEYSDGQMQGWRNDGRMDHS